MKICNSLFIYIVVPKNSLEEREVVKHAETSTNEVKLIQKINEHNGAVNGVSVFKNNLIASGSG